jgi:hypothetical protein
VNQCCLFFDARHPANAILGSLFAIKRELQNCVPIKTKQTTTNVLIRSNVILLCCLRFIVAIGEETAVTSGVRQIDCANRQNCIFRFHASTP